MKFHFRISVLLTLLIFVTNTFPLTAEELLRQCTINPNGYCLGYITGLYDGWTTSNIQEILKEQNCPPSDSSGLKLAVSNVQMVWVFMKWATDHPESLYLQDWQSVSEAFAKAWPCPH
ncbi:hypothetical protein Lsan_2020 [Legionella santicrucis]|uniref:PRELI/MSF1 domain-containing protein n=1 Tax=Legionella santicrucis TaxID=45074 RepID=A0A0W0YUF4_9GAMM|nr:Rap1a/Tai family immunity protein [Legionella santicrucis]KTD60468.1 hypothetical protein Lsan_2020 [Legionella santicrucis]